MGRWHYFPDEKVAGLDIELVAMLDRAWGISGIPFVITSGLRTVDENAALPHSVKDSAHLTGHAVDLHCSESADRFYMFKALLEVGINRIGFYASDGHLHVDNDPTKSPNVIWVRP